MPSSIPSYAGANYETNHDKSLLTVKLQKPIKQLNNYSWTGLSLIFQVDGELKKVAGGQKKPGATAVGCY